MFYPSPELKGIETRGHDGVGGAHVYYPSPELKGIERGITGGGEFQKAWLI